MYTTMSAKIHFHIRINRRQKDGSAPIYLLFYISNTQRCRINVGKYVPLKREYRKLNDEQIASLVREKKEELFCWDTKAQKATKGAESGEFINVFLDNERTKIHKILSRFELLEKPITLQAFKNAYQRTVSTSNFSEYFMNKYTGYPINKD
jgi:hypothetical protein